MSMHNKRLAHDEKKPCFVCTAATQALNRGMMEAHPRCPECKGRLAEEFAKAIQQQRKQDQAARPAPIKDKARQKVEKEA